MPNRFLLSNGESIGRTLVQACLSGQWELAANAVRNRPDLVNTSLDQVEFIAVYC
jgi:hypothetical protein